ncbi:uncharacterized protein LOC112590059 isoform X1 [Harpegnathos saltator]|uniref:uncharacterized protein LOC112590059 isoform X1 n=1 Tax=Harpegnathos saltator TaxID=610380 RepID=UPI000DBED375|nr:uncharacterized protein LOC112590059 isoform X1 [Harpegnathos saltator]
MSNDNSHIVHNRNIINDDSSSSSSNASECGTLFHDNFGQSSFREQLASCFVDNNFIHVQGNSVLSLLRTHPCFSNLPKDTRTLLNTPRNSIVVLNVEPGEYIHFDFQIALIEYLSHMSMAAIPSHIELDIHTDGCTLGRAGSVHLWPIQCRIANVQHAKPIIVGIYKGSQKPHNPNSFFEAFITDILTVVNNGGIQFNGSNIPIRLRCFIADAPARAFILNHRGHLSSKPCSKCKVSGTISEGCNVFKGINHSVRRDEEYVAVVDEDHHKEGTSPLSLIPIGMVSQVPFEYMHLVCFIKNYYLHGFPDDIHVHQNFLQMPLVSYVKD